MNYIEINYYTIKFFTCLSIERDDRVCPISQRHLSSKDCKLVFVSSIHLFGLTQKMEFLTGKFRKASRKEKQV